MIFIEPFKSFLGFGNGDAPGEYVHSQGMNKSPNGIMPLWNVVSGIDSASLSGLALINAFAQAIPNSMYVFGVDANGIIYRSLNGTGTWTKVRTPSVTAKGNGLIGTQEGELFYLQSRYLGKWDGSPNYTTGTISTINGDTTITGSGTTFTADMAGSQILIAGTWYTIATYASATVLFLSANYPGVTASGVSYEITQGWDDDFQDFGASSLVNNTDYRDSDFYEDLVVMCNGNNFATYNVDTDTFAAAAFTLSSKDFARAVRAGSNGILMGINRGNRGAFFLWDGNSDRSISPWTWVNGSIQAIVAYQGNWIVITNREILLTNGYSTQPFVSAPDNLTSQALFSVLPQGAQVVNDYLIIANNAGLTNRIRSGYWILNLKTRLWEYAPVANSATYNNTMGAVFYDSNFKTHLSWATAIPAKKYIGNLNNSQPPTAYLITEPKGQGNGQKIAEAVKLNLGVSPYQTASSPITLNISVKVYDFKRPLWTYAQQKTLAVDLNKITVDGTLSGVNNAQVGDEVTVMEGTNAGQVDHITAIATQDTATEVWTLDTSFTGYTEANAFIQVMPFKLVQKVTLTNLTSLKELFFNIKNKYKGQKFLLKILFDNIGNVPPELLEGDFIYDDLGDINTN